jgi:hypothetical protein
MRILAAAAILAHLCWPFIGQLRAATPQGEQVICTVHGAMTVPLPADQAPAPGTAKPVCALCAAAAVALDSAPPRLPVAVAAAIGSDTFLSVPARPRAHHSPARPRAPPVLS